MKTLKVYIGYDVRDELAFRACVSSLRKHSSIPLDIIPLKDHELRRKNVYWRPYHVESNGQKIDGRDGKPFSTDFSFTRFAIPLIDKSEDWVLFCDADMLFRRDVAELLKHADKEYVVQCVQHDYQPKEDTKFDGFRQERYFRKNWSSLMLLRPGLCEITKFWLNNETGSFLHGLLWQKDGDIGGLPAEWNWLEGWSNPDIDPAVVHYTRGTPDMLGYELPFAQEWKRAVESWLPAMNRNGISEVS